jgi:hypothetical protein
VLVSPTALVVSLLHTRNADPLPVAIANSREDFMRRVRRAPPRVVVVSRNWLSDADLRVLALRRAFSPIPKLVLVLGRDDAPTASEYRRFDAVVVADQDFRGSAARLKRLVADAAAVSVAPPPPPLRLVA